jgi:hypothetical protein
MRSNKFRIEWQSARVADLKSERRKGLRASAIISAERSTPTTDTPAAAISEVS